MPAPAKQARSLARQLFKLSVENGVVSAERVAGVLAYVDKHRVARPMAVLKAYQRLIATEVAKSEAQVEHAGALPEPALKAIAEQLSKKYARPVSATAKSNPALLAGI